MGTGIDSALLTLLQMTDSLLPIGAFAHSNGLETLVQEDRVRDPATAAEYLREYLRNVLQYGDALAMRLAYEAAAVDDLGAVRRIDTWLYASKIPSESKNGSVKIGMRFLKLTAGMTETSLLSDYLRLIREGECHGQHSIACGVFMAAQEVEEKQALTAYLYNQASGVITNCAKLVPLSQTAGQKVLFASQPVIREVADRLFALSFEDLGRNAVGFDIAAMRHEDLESRVYMS